MQQPSFPAPRPGHARSLLATNVLMLRRHAGLSQEALALEAGLHRTFVAHVERGARNISIDNIERLAMGLSVPPMALLAPDFKTLQSLYPD